MLILLAACGGNAGDAMDETAVSQPADNATMNEMADETAANEVEMAEEEPMDSSMDSEMSEDMDDEAHDDINTAMSEEMSDEQDGEMVDAMSDEMAEMTGGPEWLALPLTNARTGETFTLADFSGKTLFVETMATWCSNCRRQLQNVSAAKGQLGDDVVFVALSVETNVSDAELARYADNEGFDWLFAVATPELLQILADEYGRTIVNPPSTPHFIVRPDGSTTDLVTGIDSPETLVNDLMAAMQ